MSMIFDLPTEVEFGGRSWRINTDYRDVLRVLMAFEDVDLADDEKAFICLHNLYPDVQKHVHSSPRTSCSVAA